MTKAMVHCDDTVMELCDDKQSGALCVSGKVGTTFPKSNFMVSIKNLNMLLNPTIPRLRKHTKKRIIHL